VMNLSSVSGVQTMPLRLIAGEYLKSAISPALRVKMPCKLGPTLLAPASSL